jgi:predicted DNA-binding antitoxin AbrB/MazE fold protein
MRRRLLQFNCQLKRNPEVIPMLYELDAIYENGMLKLDRPLPLEEQQRVRIVVQEPVRPQQSGEKRDWWAVLQEIRADQARRGFVGTATGVDREDDDAHDARVREIMKNTVHGYKDADLP